MAASKIWRKRCGSRMKRATQVVLLGSTVGMAERLRDILHEYGIPFRCEFGEQPLKAIEEAPVPLVGIGKISGGLAAAGRRSRDLCRNRHLR